MNWLVSENWSLEVELAVIHINTKNIIITIIYLFLKGS